MRRIPRLPPRALALAAAALCLPPAVQAQPTLTANLTASSAFVWRGVTFASRPVLQGDLGLAAAVAGGTLSLGTWMNAELADYSRGRALTMVAPGNAGPALTAVAPWVDYTRSSGRVSATLGASTYVYPAITGYAEAYNTTELYGRLAVSAPLSPKLAVWHDVGKVRGAYAEGSLSQPVPLGAAARARGTTLTLGATAGWSVGQGPRGTQTAYFARDGLAFVDVSATGGVTIGRVALAPVARLTIARDSLATLVDRIGRARTLKPSLGVTATYALPVGGARR